MQALVWEAPRVMTLRECAVPEVQPGEVLIRVAYAGICGSELSGYLGHNALRVPPLVMGHEFAGEIVALGDGVQTRHPALAQGRMATVDPMIYCGTCEFCARRLNQLCANRRLVGAHRPGAFAEYVTVPAEMIFLLPAGMPARIGALAEPVACAARIGELASPVAGADVLIMGAGPIGLLALQVLRGHGAQRVFIADLDSARLAMAAELGGDVLDPRAVDVPQAVRQATGGRGVAVALDAVGTAATRKQCVAAARSAGTVILSGLHEETSAMPAADIIRREIVVRGSFCYTPANFAAALDLLARGVVRLAPWIVEAPLADGGQWFERLCATPGGVAKVLLVPGGA
ncbi:MAG: hypothetical protein A3K19_21235 [Lentisphaerae bacterium RIFOXYB12_FULL_65_16]|nr:MAG: hypothetical protein A3K18_33910 [Lentisphaerae bacterium RIFOXYA12_64_32]OGV93656.1 MAG: hypothetical protein A3K19_21235 [Lentisphaerae bacterium RIFOXYB12_FULL_65_16]